MSVLNFVIQSLCHFKNSKHLRARDELTQIWQLSEEEQQKIHAIAKNEILRIPDPIARLFYNVLTKLAIAKKTPHRRVCEIRR